MLWDEAIPRQVERDAEGRATEVALVAGRLGDRVAPAPPPRSWAARPDSDVAIWTLRLEAGARFTLPPAQPGTNRSLYFFRGDRLHVAGEVLAAPQGAELAAHLPVPLRSVGPSELLLLQGRPIQEPVAQYGPFVMNTRAEIQQAMIDYQRTQFGGWPWPSDDPVHPREEGRFARHASGRVERPG